MSAEPNLNETDYELLSAYIDEMLTDDERSALETRLENEPLLRRELTALRQTVALVNNLPPLKAPRNFTLTPEMVGTMPVSKTPVAQAPTEKPTLNNRRIIPFPSIAVLSAVASVAIVVFGLAILLGGGDDDSDNSDTSSVSMTTNSIPADSDVIAAAPTMTAEMMNIQGEFADEDNGAAFAETTEEPAPLLGVQQQGSDTQESEAQANTGDSATDDVPEVVGAPPSTEEQVIIVTSMPGTLPQTADDAGTSSDTEDTEAEADGVDETTAVEPFDMAEAAQEEESAEEPAEEMMAPEPPTGGAIDATSTASVTLYDDANDAMMIPATVMPTATIETGQAQLNMQPEPTDDPASRSMATPVAQAGGADSEDDPQMDQDMAADEALEDTFMAPTAPDAAGGMFTDGFGVIMTLITAILNLLFR